MRVTTDDALKRVDARWLGVPGFTFPWRAARYTAYAVGVPIGVVVLGLANKIAGTGFWPIVYGLAITIVLTTYLMRLVDDERPAGSLPRLLYGEISAPRRSRHDTPTAIIWDLTAIAFYRNTSGPLAPLIPSAAGDDTSAARAARTTRSLPPKKAHDAAATT